MGEVQEADLASVQASRGRRRTGANALRLCTAGAGRLGAPRDLRGARTHPSGRLAVGAGAALTLLTDPAIGALSGPFAEIWANLTLQCGVAAMFNSLTIVLIRRWAILPTWGLFIVLGICSSGGVVAAQRSRPADRLPSAAPDTDQLTWLGRQREHLQSVRRG